MKKFCLISFLGNAFFAKGPQVTRINNHDLEDIAKRCWLRHEFANIEKDVVIDNITFLSDVELKVSGIQKQWFMHFLI